MRLPRLVLVVLLIVSVCLAVAGMFGVVMPALDSAARADRRFERTDRRLEQANRRLEELQEGQQRSDAITAYVFAVWTAKLDEANAEIRRQGGTEVQTVPAPAPAPAPAPCRVVHPVNGRCLVG